MAPGCRRLAGLGSARRLSRDYPGSLVADAAAALRLCGDPDRRHFGHDCGYRGAHPRRLAVAPGRGGLKLQERDGPKARIRSGHLNRGQAMLSRQRGEKSAMAKVVVGNLKPKGRSDTTAVATRRIRSGQGEVKTLRTIDVDSRTFGSDLRYVFERNVAKARRENKRITGANDGVPKN
jgi:hypothetical protein